MSYWDEFKALPEVTAQPPAAALKVSLLIPVRGGEPEVLKKTLTRALDFLKPRFGSEFEIVVVTQAAGPGDAFPAQAEAVASSLGDPALRIVHHAGRRGKGAGLQTGFLASRGHWIWFTDADLPYDLEFFDAAAARLNRGYALVTGNRRLPESRFNLPVGLLNVAYGRHRLGLAFNAIARRLLKLPSRDTQAGIKAMTRALAHASLGRLRCPGFFFDLEIFLAARQSAWAVTELPVRLTLRSEKSTVRVLRESLLAGFWLLSIAWRARQTSQPRRVSPTPTVWRFLNLAGGLGTRVFLALRYWMTPYSEMARELPPQGRALDLGCGHGLLLWTAQKIRPELELWGIDHDAGRVELAQKALGTQARVIQSGAIDLQGPVKTEVFDAITAIDVMHYFKPAEQEGILRESFARLTGGGKLVVREVNPEGGPTSWINRSYEKLSTAVGLTRSNEKTRLHFRSRPEWEELLTGIGFDVQSRRCSHPLFADILYVCEKPEAPV